MWWTLSDARPYLPWLRCQFAYRVRRGRDNYGQDKKGRPKIHRNDDFVALEKA